jgi:hypothetical protein
MCDWECRGGESSLDVSADLTELGRTPVAVVCAGAKSVRVERCQHTYTHFQGNMCKPLSLRVVTKNLFQ